MIGAIVGDIVGSVYEWHNIKTKDFPLFRRDCFFTDDTVMTAAVALGVMRGGTESDFRAAMKELGRRYPDAGYGGRFRRWLASDDDKSYRSWGNGSAMRVSPCAWVSRVGAEPWPEELRELARRSAAVTHDHPEGIKGALAVADAIYLCRRGGSVEERKAAVRAHTEAAYGYDLSRSLDDLRPTYRFDESCQGTVPQAITAFLESADFEDAIRCAISLGGDSDTLAAITGSIAEAAYGVPAPIRKQAERYLDETLLDILRRWEAFLASRGK